MKVFIRIVGMAGAASWVVLVISFLMMWHIEATAIWQPRQPSGEYPRPLYVKGGLHYVTGEQAFLDKISKIVLAGSGVIFVLLVGIGKYFDFEKIENSN